MRYYAASYGPRYGDPLGTYVALSRSPICGQDGAGRKVEEAAEQAAEFEREDMPTYCDTQCGDCALCRPDITVTNAYVYSAKDLFNARELREYRRALMDGEIIYLPGR